MVINLPCARLKNISTDFLEEPCPSGLPDRQGLFNFKAEVSSLVLVRLSNYQT